MKNSKSLLDDANLIELQNQSKNLVEISTRLQTDSKSNRQHLILLYEESVKIISYSEKLIEDFLKSRKKGSKLSRDCRPKNIH